MGILIDCRIFFATNPSSLPQAALLLQNADTVHRLTLSSTNAAIAIAAATGFCGDTDAGPEEPTGMRVSAALGRDGVMRYFEHTPEGLCDCEIK